MDRRLAGAASATDHKMSMLQDLEREAQPTKIDALVGVVQELGPAHGGENPAWSDASVWRMIKEERVFRADGGKIEPCTTAIHHSCRLPSSRNGCGDTRNVPID